MPKSDGNTKSTEGRKGGYTSFQRVLALLGVAALVVLAVSAFFVAVLGGDSDLVFRLLAAAVFLPILIWLLLWAIGKTPQKRSGTDEQD